MPPNANPMQLIQSVISGDNPAIAVNDAGDIDNTIFAENAFIGWAPKKAKINAASQKIARSVCRIQIKNNGNAIFEGTGFIIGDGLVVTNRHVASQGFDVRTGDLLNGLKVYVNFSGNGAGIEFEITEKAVKIGFEIDDNKFLDVALLRVPTAATLGRPPLKFSSVTVPGMEVVSIGFPVKRASNSAATTKVFPADFAKVKRVSPGLLHYTAADSENAVHTCSTLEGSSGSPVCDLETGHVVGVHYWSESIVEAGNGNLLVMAFRLDGFLLECCNILGNAAVDDFIVQAIPGKIQKRKNSPSATQANGFGVLADPPDFRDYPYSPGLKAMPASLSLPGDKPATILHQGSNPSCTGYALVHVISILENIAKGKTLPSTRMAYEMARIHDEIPGRISAGSSLRGVIKGFHHNGLALGGESEWSDDEWHLTVEKARQARKLSLGSYYRLENSITDYQAALVETGALLVSARVHGGWIKPRLGKIVYKGVASQTQLAHAFVIVGYDAQGFIVLNSAGEDWSTWKNAKGRAHWSYDDWADNILDGWVLRPAVSAPGAFGKVAKSIFAAEASEKQVSAVFSPRRSDILGHAITVDRGKLVDFGRYASDAKSLGETAKFLESESALKKYAHLLLFFHSEITDEDEAMRWLTATKPFFKSNGIYPLSILLEPSHSSAFRQLLEGAKKIAMGKLAPSKSGYPSLVCHHMENFGPKLMRSFDTAIADGLGPDSELIQVLRKLVSSHKNRPVHIAGHLRGSLAAFTAFNSLKAQGIAVKTRQAIAPVIGHEFFANQAINPDGEDPTWSVFSCRDTRSETTWSAGPGKGWLDVSQQWIRANEGLVLGKALVAETFCSPQIGRTTEISRLLNRESIAESAPGEPEVINALIQNILGANPIRNAIPQNALRNLKFLST